MVTVVGRNPKRAVRTTRSLNSNYLHMSPRLSPYRKPVNEINGISFMRITLILSLSIAIVFILHISWYRFTWRLYFTLIILSPILILFLRLTSRSPFFSPPCCDSRTSPHSLKSFTKQHIRVKVSHDIFIHLYTECYTLNASLSRVLANEFSADNHFTFLQTRLSFMMRFW